jgi:two-component system response regulator AgrA
MLNFIICEDNKESLNKVSTLLNKVMMPYNFDYKIHKFTQYNNTLQALISDTTIQKIYILDVELPEVSGLEIASEIREKDWNSVIIFLTAHTECKDDVFYSRLLAIDYIAKNVLSYSRLADTIKVVLDRLNHEKILIFKYDSITYRIPHNSILYIEKVQSNKKCLIITEEGETYEVCETISNLLKILGKDFYQSHKSCIVNVTKIKHIDCIENFITFKNGVQTELLSYRHRKDLKEYVNNY